MARNVRILIVDDHYVVRQGLKAILLEHFPEATFGEASNGQEGVEVARTQPWNLVLLDISMPNRGGLDALKDIRQTKPKLPVIVLSIHPEDQFAVRVLKLGAFAYLRKESAGSELAQAVEAALSGARHITPAVAEKLANQLQEDWKGQAHETLSDREYQVMCMLASGKTVKEIASAISLSGKTISTYRSRVLEKMHLKNNSQIMRYAVRQGLVDAEGT
ncbi:MAG TPA: response regulator transcription factor [Chthoniobacterales bacterium]